MRAVGILGLVLSVLFLISLLFAIGTGGGISKDEFALVAYLFGAFVVIMGVSAIRAPGASAKLAGTVLALGLLFVVLFFVDQEYAGPDEYSINAGDWSVVAGVPLSVAAIALGWSLFRRRA